jgi:hypothetical protein
VGRNHRNKFGCSTARATWQAMRPYLPYSFDMDMGIRTGAVDRGYDLFEILLDSSSVLWRASIRARKCTRQAAEIG